MEVGDTGEELGGLELTDITGEGVEVLEVDDDYSDGDFSSYPDAGLQEPVLYREMFLAGR